MPDGSNYGSVSNLPNPKQRYGDTKIPLAYVPPSSIAYEAMAFKEGARKYGPYNWRDKAVESMTYIHAGLRHMMAYLDGEEIDPESGVPHLALAKACLGILIDSTEQGNLIDNRPIAGKAPQVLRRWSAPDTAIPPSVEPARILPRRPPAPHHANQAQTPAVKVAWGHEDPRDAP